MIITRITLSALVFSFCFSFYSKLWAEEPLEILVDEWPPYHYLNTNNQVAGFASHVFSAVMQDMSLSFSLTLQPFDEVLRKVKEGEVNGSFLAAKDPVRSAFAYFSMESIYVSEWVLLTKKPQNITIENYSDLKNLTIGVVENYVYSPEFIKAIKRNNISLQTYENDSLNYQMLFVGKVNFVVGEKDNSLWFLRRNNLQKNIQVVPDFVIARNPLYFIWSKKRSSQAFADTFAQHLKKYKNTQDYKERLNNFLNH